MDFQITVRRYKWLPRTINDWREGNAVKSYICPRIGQEYVNAYYRILPGKSLAGERPRSLFVTLANGEEIVYKMTACNIKDGYEHLTFLRFSNDV